MLRLGMFPGPKKEIFCKMRMIKTALFVNPAQTRDNLDYVYGAERLRWIRENTDLYPTVITSGNIDELLPELSGVEAIFSTWGMVPVSAAQLQMMPNLKCLFYAAGATTAFRGPFVERGITVCSATEANAIPVAEFCLGQILLAMTGYFRNIRAFSRPLPPEERMRVTGPGNYGGRVALIGAGTISRKLQELLKPFHLEVVVVPSRAENRTVSLEEAFRTSMVVSNHLPDRDDNVGVLHEALFRTMPEGATFINTGRGRQIDEAGLARVMAERPDLSALLDVQYPEPPVADSPFYNLANVFLTTHIAGSKNDEVGRMADYMLDDFKRYAAGEPMRYIVQPGQL